MRRRHIVFLVVLIVLLLALSIEYWSSFAEDWLSAQEIFQEGEEKLSRGELLLRPVEDDIAKSKKLREKTLDELGQRILPVPKQIKDVFNLVVENHPLSRDMSYSFRLVVYTDESPAAGTYADGTVFLPSAAILMLENEAELAGIFAHEATHVFERHSAEMVALREYLLDHGVDRGMTRLLIFYTFGGRQQIRADEGAMELLWKLGYDPCARLTYVKRNRFGEGRIRAMEEKVDCKASSGDLFKIMTREEFEMMKEEFRAMISE